MILCRHGHCFQVRRPSRGEKNEEDTIHSMGRQDNDRGPIRVVPVVRRAAVSQLLVVWSAQFQVSGWRRAMARAGRRAAGWEFHLHQSRTSQYPFYTDMNISYVQPHAGSAFQPIPSLKHRHTSEWCRMWIRLGPSCIPQIHREETTTTSTGYVAFSLLT